MERYIKSAVIGALVFILTPQSSFEAVSASVPVTLTIQAADFHDEIIEEAAFVSMTGDNPGVFVWLAIAVFATAIIIYMASMKGKDNYEKK